MDVILIWLAVCWEIEEGDKMSEKLRKEGIFELKHEDCLDRFKTDQVRKGYLRQRTVKTKSKRKNMTSSI